MNQFFYQIGNICSFGKKCKGMWVGSRKVVPQETPVNRNLVYCLDRRKKNGIVHLWGDFMGYALLMFEAGNFSCSGYPIFQMNTEAMTKNWTLDTNKRKQFRHREK